MLKRKCNGNIFNLGYEYIGICSTR